MTRLDPSLILTHLTVLKDGREVYDQEFGTGVNIIRGENGSGKSTVADFIFHALGGEVSSWRSEALSCDFTYAEVEIAGEPITVRREVASERRRPMSLFWGNMEDARKQGVKGWHRFPFAASANKESFTQVLFNLLGLPDILREDLQARITMHQVLRLLYVDQRTPFDRIFFEDDWDQQLTRAAVGDLLLGTYDDALYRLRLDVKSYEERIGKIRSELRSIGEVLGSGDRALTPGALSEAISNANTEQERLRSRLAEEDTEEQEVEDVPDVSADIRSVAEALRQQQQTVRRLAEDLEGLEFEIQDSQDLIVALKRRIEALDDSDTTRQALGAATFVYCPSCYSDLQADEANEDRCPVCKSPYEEGVTPNILRLRYELTSQLEESIALQRQRREERTGLQQDLREASSTREELQGELDLLTGRAVSTAEAQRAELHRKIGYLQRQVEDLEEKRKLAERLEQLERERDELVALHEKALDQLQTRENLVAKRRSEVQDVVARNTVALLHQDLPRERAFETAERVTFDFGKDSIGVDGRDNFAASSMVYLKNAFHLALLLASMDLDYMRYPRFALFDNVEDKGMEPERSHNFQRLVVEKSEASEVVHQIIMTTSMINPDLDGSEYAVGPHYTHEHRTLDIAS